MSSMMPGRFRFNPIEHEPFEHFPYGRPRIDWKETRAAHVIKADLPGFRRGDVTVEIRSRSNDAAAAEGARDLVISGERREEEEEEEEIGDTWQMTETSSGRFGRAVSLPKNAMAEDATAAMEDGVLTVIIPKGPEAKKPAVRFVQIL